MPYHAIDDPEQLHALLDAVLTIESDLDLSSTLRRIVESACTLTGARYGALGVLDPTGRSLAQLVQVGMDDATVEAIGRLPEGAGVVGRLIRDPVPLRLKDLTTHPDSVGVPEGHPPMRSFLGVPLRVGGEVFGNLYLTEKQGAEEFTDLDEQLVVALASAAGLAVKNARLHARVGELTLAADRGRIARDLHDTVLQRLFAVGLSLQSVVPVTEVPEVRARILEAVSALDETIREIRTTIFELAPPPGSHLGLREEALTSAREAARSLGFEPEVRFKGAIDSVVPRHVVPEAISTLREALSNVARHAHAHGVEITVSVEEGELVVDVRDDGVGPGARASGGRGIGDMEARAARLGGACTVEPRTGGGTEVTWRVPIGRTSDEIVA